MLQIYHFRIYLTEGLSAQFYLGPLQNVTDSLLRAGCQAHLGHDVFSSRAIATKRLFTKCVDTPRWGIYFGCWGFGLLFLKKKKKKVLKSEPIVYSASVFTTNQTCGWGDSGNLTSSVDQMTRIQKPYVCLAELGRAASRESGAKGRDVHTHTHTHTHTPLLGMRDRGTGKIRARDKDIKKGREQKNREGVWRQRQGNRQ